MTYKKKTYKEKLNNPQNKAEVKKIEPKYKARLGNGTLLIPTPLEVDEIMKKVPVGKLITINLIREKLAKKHKATICCPICAGIFSNISAHAADEDEGSGIKDITPYWRTLKGEGELNPKYPGGIDNLKSRLESEGCKVTKKGKNKYVVVDYEKYLIKI